MERYGQVIKVNNEMLEKYKELHKEVWLEVLDMISKCNIKNYSIFYREGYLFAYFEYYGDNFDKDMQIMEADAVTQSWWNLCKPCQIKLESCSPKEWWADMEELFHMD